MRWKWINSEPDDQGDIELVIENNTGNRVSTFKGKTKDEIIEALAKSQVEANRRLGELLAPDKAKPPGAAPVSDADRLRLAGGMTDPSRVVETITEIVDTSQRTKAEQDAYYAGEAEAFVRENPDYYRDPAGRNQKLLFDRLIENKYDLTRNNLGIVFRQLWEEDKMAPWPDDGGDEELEPVRAQPSGRERGSTTVIDQPRPTSRASGLRNSDANAQRPAPSVKKPLITKAELEKMPRAEYTEKLRDPAFRKAVDALG